MKAFIDGHVHSYHSHDSKAIMEETCVCAVQAGLAGVAFTDHCDIEFCREMDVLTPILDCVAEAKRISKNYAAEEDRKTMIPPAGKLEIFTGIELGEAIWFPETARRAINQADYDVVLGSVHAIRFQQPYSRIDFGAYSPLQLEGFLNQYFEDVYQMCRDFSGESSSEISRENDLKNSTENAQQTSFDVLTHLTCPLRYMILKYHRSVSLQPFSGRIDDILRSIIASGRTLEVNTSGYREEDPFWMPEVSILERYRSLGGTRICIGSDAHISTNVGKGFPQAAELLQSLGFDHLTFYRKRVPFEYELQ